MTKEDWKKAEEQCSLFSSCNLLCDGYRIGLKEVRNKYRILIAIYVDGSCKGSWFLKENENCPQLKFYPQKRTYLHNKAWRMQMKKTAKALKNSDYAKDAEKKYSYREMFATSFSQIKKHLIKVCQSIELIND